MLDAIRCLHIVEGVVGVFQIGAVQHHQNDEQPLVRFRADERILLPGPLPQLFEVFDIRPEAAAGLLMRALVVPQDERLHEIDGRLVIAERRQDPRLDDFDVALVTLRIIAL